MIIFLCIIQITLSILIGGSIVFSKSNSNPTSSITNNFTGGSLNSKSRFNIKPRTKLMFVFVFFFFANSIFLTKQIDLQKKQHKSLISKKLEKSGFEKDQKKPQPKQGNVPF